VNQGLNPRMTQRGESDKSIGDRSDAQAIATTHDGMTWPRTPKSQRALVFILAAYACLRIMVFAAAFPLFNNVDEQLHFTSIQMYAQGHLPGKELPHMNPDVARSLVGFWSPEYGHTQEQLEQSGFPGTAAPKSYEEGSPVGQLYQAKLQEWLRRPNFEAQSPPVYYLLAAVWYRLGIVAGLRSWELLYWLRFLSAPLYAIFVWVSYKFSVCALPEDSFFQVAVAAILAVFPQDVFFGLNRDVLSPLICATALLFMVYALTDLERQTRLLLIASALVGVAFLVEVSNFVLYGTIAVTLGTLLGTQHATWKQRLSLICAAGLSIVMPLLWMLRNYAELGDLTGSSRKLVVLGWKVNSPSQVWQHPLFTWHGLGYFLMRLTGSFWHGEYGWHAQILRSEYIDCFYVFSSALMITLFVIWMARRWVMLSGTQRWAGTQALILVASSVVFLATLSILFDFPDGGYPSKLSPYLVSGRIVSGVLLPFIFLYAKGFEVLANQLRQWVHPSTLLAALTLGVTCSDLWIRRHVFASPLNFYALTHLTR